MTIDEAVNIAAGHLPEGWIVAIEVERGAGWVALHDGDGEAVDFDTSPDKTLGEQLHDAVNHAITASI
jgi:hypothetical protein